MEQILKQLVVLIIMLLCMREVSYSYAADNFLQNPDFKNVTVNGTSLLDPTSSHIPGWSFTGKVYYVTSNNDSSSFPASGRHAIQLAENGTINQTVRIKGNGGQIMDFILSFNLAAPNRDCASDRTTIAVNVTAYQASVLESSEVIRSERSEVFFYYGRDFSRRLWESNAFYFGQLGDRDYVNLEIKSHVSTDDDHRNATRTCWPLVDGFIVKRNRVQRWYTGHSLSNGDFETGPSFLKNSYVGILLNQDQETVHSRLEEWTILGAIRYIDSKHYRVPQGKAAIELLSELGKPSGIQIELYLGLTSSTYTLNFTMGDANDSCVGDFVLRLEIGENVQKFTVRSRGTGSAFRHSVTIKGEPSNKTSTIRFYSLNETRTSDGVLCGPVLDQISLFGFYGESVNNGVSLEIGLYAHIFLVVVVDALYYFMVY